MTITVITIAAACIIGHVAYETFKCMTAKDNELLSCTVEFRHDVIAYRACCKLRRFFYANKDSYVLKSLSIEKVLNAYFVTVKYSIVSKYVKHVNFAAVLASLTRDDVSSTQ